VAEFINFLREQNIDWIQILDNLENDSILRKMCMIKAIPTYILIDREGTIVDSGVGELPTIPL